VFKWAYLIGCLASCRFFQSEAIDERQSAADADASRQMVGV
jgi:hypothetical protein